MLLSSCSSVKVETSAGICEGLELPVDDLADALLDNQKETPDPVLITGTRVIKGYDAGCDT